MAGQNEAIKVGNVQQSESGILFAALMFGGHIRILRRQMTNGEKSTR